MVLDPLYSYFVFLIYTNGYSNHYECVWGTVLAVNFGICRRMIWEISKLLFFNFSKHLDKSVFINSFHLPLTNTKIISQYRSPYTPVVIWIAVRVYEKNKIIVSRIQNHWNFAAVLNGSQQTWSVVWIRAADELPKESLRISDRSKRRA